MKCHEFDSLKLASTLVTSVLQNLINICLLA